VSKRLHRFARRGTFTVGKCILIANPVETHVNPPRNSGKQAIPQSLFAVQDTSESHSKRLREPPPPGHLSKILLAGVPRIAGDETVSRQKRERQRFLVKFCGSAELP